MSWNSYIPEVMFERHLLFYSKPPTERSLSLSPLFNERRRMIHLHKWTHLGAISQFSARIWGKIRLNGYNQLSIDLNVDNNFAVLCVRISVTTVLNLPCRVQCDASNTLQQSVQMAQIHILSEPLKCDWLNFMLNLNSIVLPSDFTCFVSVVIHNNNVLGCGNNMLFLVPPEQPKGTSFQAENKNGLQHDKCTDLLFRTCMTGLS